MRDTGDMMEDSFSEDTMMECSGDDTVLDDLVDLTDDVSHSAPTIRDAAELLLTLLVVDDDENYDLSSSEDEGVELDEDSDDNDDDEDNEDNEPESTRLLHQLATSLAQELKYSQKQSNKMNTRLATVQHGAKIHHETTRGHDQVQRMEVAHDISHQESTRSSKYSHQVEQTLPYKVSASRAGLYGTASLDSNASSGKYRKQTRLRIAGNAHEEGKNISSTNSAVTDSWTVGWDACAAEAIRYLVEDEGLSPHHPTVLAMKSHLEIQRERALAQCAV